MACQFFHQNRNKKILSKLHTVLLYVTSINLTLLALAYYTLLARNVYFICIYTVYLPLNAQYKERIRQNITAM